MGIYSFSAGAVEKPAFSSIAALYRGQPLHIPHTDFISVINIRRTGHGEQKREGKLFVITVDMACKSVHIMIPRRYTDKPPAPRTLIAVNVFLNKPGCVAAALEERFGAAEQVIVMG